MTTDPIRHARTDERKGERREEEAYNDTRRGWQYRSFERRVVKGQGCACQREPPLCWVIRRAPRCRRADYIERLTAAATALSTLLDAAGTDNG